LNLPYKDKTPGHDLISPEPMSNYFCILAKNPDDRRQKSETGQMVMGRAHF
jgi:hypothetical protein